MDNKVLIIGAYGLLGTALSSFLSKNGFNVLRSGRKEFSEINLDALDINSLENNINNLKPDYIINLAAITDVDFCESNKIEAFSINTDIPKNISKLKNKYSYRFIHISTDQVYQGNGPHKESETNPINIYSKSKLKGEDFVLENGGVILRTNFVGKSKNKERKSFTDWLFENAKNNKKFSLFSDVNFNPVHINDLCEIISVIAKDFQTGCFNLGSRGKITKAEFGIIFLKNLKFDTSSIRICSVKESYLKANRPFDMTMDVSKISKNFNKHLPTIKETIDKCIKEYKIQ